MHSKLDLSILTARKCGRFGVCNDGKGQLVNYLIDEAQNPGKGADCVGPSLPGNGTILAMEGHDGEEQQH